MRENMGLYRGKRKDNGEWIEGYYCNCIRDMNGEKTHPAIQQTNDNSLYFREILPETVGQYTGLTDKNGVKIFEGDIVKGIAYSVERIGVIVWIDEIASFGVRYFKSQNPTAWENSSILRCASMGKTDEFAAKIIGNIHDNPELLGNASQSYASDIVQDVLKPATPENFELMPG